MHRNARLALIIYGSWCVLLLGVAVIGRGELALGAHFWLVFTGLPSALLSLHFQHGSILGVGIAALLGLAQWPLVAQLDSWLVQRKIKKNPSES